MTFTLGLPQAIWIAMTFAGLIHVCINHGKIKTKEQNVWSSIFASAVVFVLLYWGGFFSGGAK